MRIERAYQKSDDVVVEFVDPDVELVIVQGYELAVWRDSESGEIIGDVEIGLA